MRASRSDGVRKVVALLASVALILAAYRAHVQMSRSSADPAPAAVFHPTSVDTAVLTRDGADGYDIAASYAGVRASALPRNTNGNLRMVFWPKSSAPTRDSESCSVWTKASDGVQQGAALRVSTDDDATTAITITKNVVGGWEWVFNIHSWSGSTLEPTRIASINLYRVLFPKNVLAPYPWHFCARVVGRQLALKVWLNGEPTPAWGDRTHSGSVTLPADAVRSGYTGWFVGHLPPGGTADFTGLTTRPTSGR